MLFSIRKIQCYMVIINFYNILKNFKNYFKEFKKKSFVKDKRIGKFIILRFLIQIDSLQILISENFSWEMQHSIFLLSSRNHLHSSCRYASSSRFFTFGLLSLSLFPSLNHDKSHFAGFSQSIRPPFLRWSSFL